VRSFMTAYSPSTGCGEFPVNGLEKTKKILKKIDSITSSLAKLKPMDKQKRSKQTHGRKEHKYGKNCIQNRTKLIHTLWKKAKNIRHHMHYTLSNLLLDNFQKILLPTFKTGEMVQKDTHPFGRKTARDMLTWSHYEFQQRLIWKAVR